jgi:hypothetical protein
MDINQMNFTVTFYEIQLITLRNVCKSSMNNLAHSKQEFTDC